MHEYTWKMYIKLIDATRKKVVNNTWMPILSMGFPNVHRRAVYRNQSSRVWRPVCQTEWQSWMGGRYEQCVHEDSLQNVQKCWFDR